MADQSKLCTITNNSGQDAVVALTISADETGSPDAIISLNQQLEILKTSSGNTIIENGSSDTVTLDHDYKPSALEIGYVPNYNLIISDSNWLYPLANLSVVQQGTNGTASYAPQTVGTTDVAAMTQAFDFCKSIAAYPDSSLTQNYMNTLAQAQESGSDIENAMASFFQSTVNYKNVTLADVMAIQYYYDNFPCAWAQYQDSITYYLYSGTWETTFVFVGILTMYKPGAIDITKPNSGYTCSFAPAINPSDTTNADVDTSKAVNLTYASRAFVDDINASAPKIALKGNFNLKRAFTRKPDDSAIMPAFTGMVNGTACTGINVPMYQY